MSVRQRIQREFAAGRLDERSGLGEVRGIGEYILKRVRDYLRLAGPVTIGSFWSRTRGMSNAQIQRFLLRALQNRRGNQCVAKTSAPNANRSYHTQDINHHAYEAVVTLLDRGRTRPGGVAYGPLRRRMPSRSLGSKVCGCRAVCDGPCRRNADGACVPRRGNGFVGSPPHPDQIVRATTDAQRRSINNAARTRMSASARADADTMQDVRSGHRKSMRYSSHRTRMSRVPSPKVRLPNA